MIEMPDIMVAPNGARKTTKDHPAIPVTVDEVISVARQCHASGAPAIHAHVRDDDKAHALDPVRYRQLLDGLAAEVPNMIAQITTEAVGRFSQSEQIECVKQVRPKAVSSAIKELVPEAADTSAASTSAAAEYYNWCAGEDVHVQHILYEPSEIVTLKQLIEQGVIGEGPLPVLFVIGRYTPNMESDIADLDAFISQWNAADLPHKDDWMVCAFGRNETACLLRAFEHGGKARVGFENSVYLGDGTIAPDNAAKVADLIRQKSELVSA